MSVPRLTIPESAFNPNDYVTIQKKSRLFRYIITLTNGSALFLILVYLVGYLGIKPLLELTTSRRIELLEKYRHRATDVYLRLVSKVDYIPIIGYKEKSKHNVVVDQIIQTTKSTFSDDKLSEDQKLEALENKDKLSQIKLHHKLTKLNDLMKECTSYLAQEMFHYKVIRDQLKQFQNQVDTKLFDYDELCSVTTNVDNVEKRKDLVVDTKSDIRGIKGLYMSGKA